MVQHSAPTCIDAPPLNRRPDSQVVPVAQQPSTVLRRRHSARRVTPSEDGASRPVLFHVKRGRLGANVARSQWAGHVTTTAAARASAGSQSSANDRAGDATQTPLATATNHSRSSRRWPASSCRTCHAPTPRARDHPTQPRTTRSRSPVAPRQHALGHPRWPGGQSRPRPLNAIALRQPPTAPPSTLPRPGRTGPACPTVASSTPTTLAERVARVHPYSRVVSPFHVKRLRCHSVPAQTDHAPVYLGPDTLLGRLHHEPRLELRAPRAERVSTHRGEAGTRPARVTTAFVSRETACAPRPLRHARRPQPSPGPRLP